MAMQLCRLDVKVIVVSLENDDNYKNKLGYINNNENIKVL
jgi:hypothetical protein